MNYKLTNPLVGLLCVSDIKMHFLLAGGSSSSSEELSIVKSITSTFFLLVSLATVTEQGLLRTLEPDVGKRRKRKKKNQRCNTHPGEYTASKKPHTLLYGWRLTP